MISSLFIGFVVLMFAIVLAGTARYLGRGTAFVMGKRLLPWLIYVGAMSYSGVVGKSTRPPGTLFILIPVLFLFVVLIRQLRTSAGAHLALALPLWLVLGTQCFRVGVELFIHQLWRLGIVPRMLTFEGANIDIYVGASAPLIAYLSTCGRFGLQTALLWNVASLCILGNVVIRAVLTTPAIHALPSEVPNLMFATFPFTFIPGFFVPLAVTLHVLALVAISRKLRNTSTVVFVAASASN